MKRFKNILCVLDDKATAGTVLQQAAAMARKQQARVTLLSVVERPPRGFILPGAEHDAEQVLAAIQAQRQEEIARWRDRDMADQQATIVVAEGKGFLAVIRQVLRASHDLVVKCRMRNDWDEQRPGSDDMHLLRKCPCPVLLLSPTTDMAFKQVMASVDVSDGEEDSGESGRVQQELNRQVLDCASLMAASDDATLDIASIWESYGEHFLRYGVFSQTPESQIEAYVEKSRRECRQRLDALIDELRERIGEEAMSYLDPQPHLVKGVPQEQIVRLVNEYQVDLLVMGTVARTGIPGFIIGNTAEAILSRVACSVLAIKPEGFVSPVTL